jgi:hypothetical protein
MTRSTGVSIPPEKLLRALLLRSIRSARSGSGGSGSTSTCCSAGSSGLASMIRSETTRPFPRTGIATGRRRGGTVPRRSTEPAQDTPPARGRAPQRRWHARRSLGVDEELPAQRCWRRGLFLGCRRAKTHASTTDDDARLYREGHGRESRLPCLGHVLSENRHGLVLRAAATPGGSWRGRPTGGCSLPASGTGLLRPAMNAAASSR